MIPSVRSWLYGNPTSERSSGAEIASGPNGISSAPTFCANYNQDTTPTQDTIDDDETDHYDMPPAFPSPYSIQRVGPTTPTSLHATSVASGPVKSANKLMPPPSLIPPVPNNIRIPSSRDSSNNSLKLPPSTTRRPAAKREKVVLAPGHSPLDWARLKTSGQDLRGVTQLSRITPSQLKAHNTPDDAWASFNGKVYNITPYLSFHPGGEKQLLRAAGRDGTRLFALTHAWVNVEIMLDECLVGFLVAEPSSAA